MVKSLPGHEQRRTSMSKRSRAGSAEVRGSIPLGSTHSVPTISAMHALLIQVTPDKNGYPHSTSRSLPRAATFCASTILATLERHPAYSLIIPSPLEQDCVRAVGTPRLFPYVIPAQA